jgi:hypothetical protein
MYCGAKDAAKFCVSCGRAQSVPTSPAADGTQQKPELPSTLLPDKSLSCERRVESMCDQAFELAGELTGGTEIILDRPASTASAAVNGRVDPANRQSPLNAPPPLPARWQSENQPPAMPEHSTAPATWRAPPVPPQVGDWVHSLDYETVLHTAVPRERIAMATRRVKAGVGGEDLLKLFDKVSPYGIPLAKLNNAVLPIYEKLGIKTGQQFSLSFNAPAGHVMLALLCALAERGLGISDVQQAVDRCTLVAEVPLGFITNRGRLMINLQSQVSGQIELAIATEILGQVFDWGRSKRLSDELSAAIHRELAAITASAMYQSRVA